MQVLEEQNSELDQGTMNVEVAIEEEGKNRRSRGSEQNADESGSGRQVAFASHHVPLKQTFSLSSVSLIFF